MISENKFVYALWLADSADVGVEFSKEEAQELARMIDGYLARIAELEAERRWIPVSERLPEEKQSVLALDRTGTAYHWEYSKCLSNMFIGDYTHWMPLPEPPEVKE